MVGDCYWSISYLNIASENQNCGIYYYVQYMYDCLSVCMFTRIIFYIIGNGYITTEVLREILKELDDKITAEDLDMMIAEIDSDGSGTVDFDGMYWHTVDDNRSWVITNK